MRQICFLNLTKLRALSSSTFMQRLIKSVLHAGISQAAYIGVKIYADIHWRVVKSGSSEYSTNGFL